MAKAHERTPLNELSVAERILLVQDLWDSIAADQGVLALTDAQRAELDRRLAAYESNPNDVISWEQIRDSLRKAAG